MLKAVSDELLFVDKSAYELPEVPGFSYSTEGAVATFTRQFGNESIAVKLDANSGMEVDNMGTYSSDVEEDEMGVGT